MEAKHAFYDSILQQINHDFARKLVHLFPEIANDTDVNPSFTEVIECGSECIAPTVPSMGEKRFWTVVCEDKRWMLSSKNASAIPVRYSWVRIDLRHSLRSHKSIKVIC